ncbi:hypothetical protein KSX_69190 [Ktedonospora formicarum]|uniref:histidine kinase n=2 Tax=Ktedonospora formicarum TaxID=2778364 RepID=A0A8J3I4W3_9CHLR|nr:hypothetical protein KSX_69190 [Ktedonospora formicarum]
MVLMMLFLTLPKGTSSQADPVFFSERIEQQADLQATLSHELRSPLAAIKGYVETLLRYEYRLQPEERHEFLLAIDEASTRLTDIIQHLLEWSELETGAVLLSWSQVNVAALARESLLAAKLRWEQEPHASAQERTFSLSILDESGLLTLHEPIIEADQQRLRKVLEQVLHNALLYSPKGGAIEVVVRPVPPAECQAKLEENRPSRWGWSHALATSPVLEISVRDQGIGIPQHAHERIFERFGRVDMSLTRDVNGLGLGLAISQRIVALHQGVIWVESEVGEGSTFHIWLPYRKEEGL